MIHIYRNVKDCCNAQEFLLHDYTVPSIIYRYHAFEFDRNNNHIMIMIKHLSDMCCCHEKHHKLASRIDV